MGNQLEKIAEKYGLILVGKQRFESHFKEKKKSRDGWQLLERIKALEIYPPYRADFHSPVKTTLWIITKLLGTLSISTRKIRKIHSWQHSLSQYTCQKGTNRGGHFGWGPCQKMNGKLQPFTLLLHLRR